MKKVIVHADGSVTFKNTGLGGHTQAFDSLSEYQNSPHYHPSVPILQQGVSIPYVSAVKAKRVSLEESDVLKARPNFKFGADPEGFVVNADGKAVTPTMIPGTKEKPHKVDGGAIQRDGMAAEYNVDPANTFTEWNKNHEKVQKALNGFLPEGHKMSWVPSVEFDEDVFADAPDEYKELGCSPDWNAWEADLNPPPYCEDRPYLRTAAGHIHIGWGENYSLDDALHQQNCFDFVKQLDWYLGGWSLKHDSDSTRRSLYGNAGACRLKPYGVEYRVLSNFWVTTTERRKAVWNRLQMAIRAMEDRFMPERAPEGYNDKLIVAINTGVMEPEFKKLCKFPFQTSNAGYASF
jgi:hypothetical protein